MSTEASYEDSEYLEPNETIKRTIDQTLTTITYTGDSLEIEGATNSEVKLEDEYDNGITEIEAYTEAMREFGRRNPGDLGLAEDWTDRT